MGPENQLPLKYIFLRNFLSVGLEEAINASYKMN